MKKIKRQKYHAEVLIEQLNEFTNQYAFKYPQYENLEDRMESPYKLIDMRKLDLTNAQREALINLYDDYCITPQNVLGEKISDENKLDLISEYLDENRTLFRREEERIIYTEAFRRLQYKTQVMVNSASDDQRTRLLHSLEVQKIARKIAIALKANYELTETIAIAHDIGHAPFGHAGEKAIKTFLENNMAGSFSHALQSVKVIDFLCSHRALKPKGIKGLGVSDLVLEGVLKHDSDSFTDDLSSAEFRLQYDCEKLYKPVSVKNEGDYAENGIYIGGIESQIVYWADKIAYLGHDWEEFVAVDLLEVMLSRINSIIIQLDEFVENIKDEKYTHISKKEKDVLCKLEKSFNEVKEKFVQEDYSSNSYSNEDNFVKALDNLIQVCYDIVVFLDKKNDEYIFFSNEQYKTLYAFFKVAHCWMIITKKKPEKIGGKIDIIFIIYKYLNDTTSHRTVPALIKSLIESCREELITAGFSRDEMIKKCNSDWKETKKNFYEMKGHDARSFKQMLKNTFIVHYDQEHNDAIEYISQFIHQELINSTRVKYMTKKAEMIIQQLMCFYYENYQMLPLKYRNRIEFEMNQRVILDKTKDLLIEYYKEQIFLASENDKKNFYEKPFDFPNLRERIIKKFNVITSENHSLSSRATPEVVEESVINLIKAKDEITKDVLKLRVIADYVSGMTDRMAEMKYNEICSSGTQWSKAYSERGTFNL